MSGLSTAEATARLARIGPNALPARRPDSPWRRLIRQFASPLVVLLLCALAFDLGLWLHAGRDGWPVEATAIGLILLVNAGLGLYQDYRSEAALARLKALAGTRAWVLRDGHYVRLPTELLVPGDRVRLEAGDRVPADGTLSDARGVMADESMLTGESVPVDKTDRAEMFGGTLLVRGRAELDITRTGASSAVGRLATMLEDIQTTSTPLERKVNHLGRQIARWVLGLTAVFGVAGVAAEGLARAPEMIVFAVALAVSAVPEGLPAVLTVALALGVERMARRQAIVRRLSAVESLGSVTVIATDKTGTLTEGRMDVRAMDTSDLPRALVAIVLANDADGTTDAGDPIDLGLLRYAVAQDVDVSRLRRDRPVVGARPFDSEWKFSRITVLEEGRPVSYLKGAPEAVLGRCTMSDEARTTWMDKATTHAAEGLRVLAVAWAEGETEVGLSLLGFVLFWDPPRREVAPAIRAAQAAGIRVIMITGDHPATALTVARQIGIPGTHVTVGDDRSAGSAAGSRELSDEDNVFARARPEQKLQLVEALQARHHVVAMTGDGVNDAPALKRADVGIAMGQRGSDVSREVADLVLFDDNFATIVGAVEEGRSIYENIQKFLRFLFSTNLSEVLVVAAGSALAFALNLRDESGMLLLPLTAVQILWINLMTDGLPAMALTLDRNPGLMHQPPRPAAAPLLDRPSLQFIVMAGTMKALLALALLGLVPKLGYDVHVTRAVVFHVMAIGQLLMTYPARHTTAHPVRNHYLNLAVPIGIGVQVAAGVLPWAARLLGRAGIPAELWGLVAVSAIAAWALAELIARLVWRRRAWQQPVSQ